MKINKVKYNSFLASYNMHKAYLFDILFTWFRLTQILIINKLFTKGHKIFLQRMTNYLEINNSLSWKALEPWIKVRNSLKISFSCQKKL